MPSGKGPRPAECEEIDEDTGKRVSGSRRTATTVVKERPRLSRDARTSSSRKPRSEPGQDTGPFMTPADSSQPGKGEDGIIVKTVKEERRKSASSGGGKRRSSSRPPSTHESRGLSDKLIQTKKRDDPTYYGQLPLQVGQVVSQPTSIRTLPIATQTYSRPLSYHGYGGAPYGHGPPPSMSAYYNTTAMIQPTSFPPTSTSPLTYSVVAPQDYFDTRPTRALEKRFEPIEKRFEPRSRSSSAYGMREPSDQIIADAYRSGYNDVDDGYVSASEPGRRRASIREPSWGKADDDYERMPPPAARPTSILRRTTTITHPRTSTAAYPETSDTGATLYSEAQPQYRDERPRLRRSTANRNSVSYNLGGGSERYEVVETAKNGRRPQSYYGQSASTGSHDWEDKAREAESYQHNVAGGPQIPLTAEFLKKQQRREAGSSRSTKSSASRDESDYRRSATTRTTRSGSGADDENVTIKVTGQARVLVGGAEIECPEGGQIQIQRKSSVRGGSERSVSEYGQPRIDDRRSRVDLGTSRTRMSSAPRKSYTRASQQIPAQHNNWV